VTRYCGRKGDNTRSEWPPRATELTADLGAAAILAVLDYVLVEGPQKVDAHAEAQVGIRQRHDENGHQDGHHKVDQAHPPAEQQGPQDVANDNTFACEQRCRRQNWKIN